MCSDCGLFYDKVFLMWGDYKDTVHEFTMEMNQHAHGKLPLFTRTR